MFSASDVFELRQLPHHPHPESSYCDRVETLLYHQTTLLAAKTVMNAATRSVASELCTVPSDLKANGVLFQLDKVSEHEAPRRTNPRPIDRVSWRCWLMNGGCGEYHPSFLLLALPSFPSVFIDC